MNVPASFTRMFKSSSLSAMSFLASSRRVLLAVSALVHSETADSHLRYWLQTSLDFCRQGGPKLIKPAGGYLHFNRCRQHRDLDVVTMKQLSYLLVYYLTPQVAMQTDSLTSATLATVLIVQGQPLQH